MKANGLYLPDGTPAYIVEHNNENDNTEPNNDNTSPDTTHGYRYENTQKSIDSINYRKDIEIQMMKDSLKKVKDQMEENNKKLNDKKPVGQQVLYLPNNLRKDFFVRI